MRALSKLLLAMLLWLTSSSAALAATSCSFRSLGSTLFLERDCWTSATIEVPDGATLDGRNHTITAVDPKGGHFIGAVIRNAGPTAHVRDLNIAARDLADVCDGATPSDRRLRGILFDAAAGTIVGNRVVGLNQGDSGCQEGAAIEVRGPTEQGATALRVSILDNHVERYQKTGIYVSGAIDASIVLNRIRGVGPTKKIAQNGIQVTEGARATIQWNRIEQNIYTGGEVASAGILLTRAGGAIEIQINRIEDNDLGVRVVSTSDTVVQWNDVSGSTFSGIAVEGLQLAAQGNQVVRNRVTDNTIGVAVLGAGALSNEVIGNRISDNLEAGVQLAFGASGNVIEHNRLLKNVNGALIAASDNDIVGNEIASSDTIGLRVEGTGNDVQDNAVTGSGAIDIEDAGGNAYRGNRCATSSGAPVDCP